MGKVGCDIWEKWVGGWRNQIQSKRGRGVVDGKGMASVACGENGCVGERNTEARDKHTPTISWEMRCGVNGRMEGACEENAQAHKNGGGNEFDSLIQRRIISFVGHTFVCLACVKHCFDAFLLGRIGRAGGLGV